MFRADTLRRVFASSGGVFAAFGVGLAAYASHAALAAGARAPLQTAAMFALLHGIALAALAPAPAGRTRLCALAMLVLGTLLFSGALVARHVFGMSSAPAPFGGTLLILGWLVYAADALRR